MKLYICNDVRIARWRKYILSDKKLSLAFAKKCISDFIGEKEQDVEIVFTKNEYGKPFVASIYKIIRDKNKEESGKIKMDIPLFFSLSHSDNMMVCAVACFNIGADCQKKNIKIDDIGKCRKIAGRFFTEQENIFLDNLTEEQKYIDNFFKIWTKKEAYIKYTGKGLSEGLQTFLVASETRQKSYCGEVYFNRIHLDGLKTPKIPRKSKKPGKTEKDDFLIYLCYNKSNKSIWQVKYFN